MGKKFRKLKRTLFELYQILEASISSVIGIYFWWYRLFGRRAEAERTVQDIMSRYSRRVFRLLGCSVQVEGAENVPKTDAYIVMANHQSRYDIVLLTGFLGRTPGFVAKKELFRFPPLAFWLRQLHSIPLDRKNISSGAAALQQYGKDIKKHHRGMIIFPEGTRTKDPSGEIQQFRQGSLRLALENQIPILPISIDGTRYLERIEDHHRTPREARHVRMKIGTPILAEAKNAPERKKFMEELREVIVSNWKSIRVEWPKG